MEDPGMEGPGMEGAGMEGPGMEGAGMESGGSLVLALPIMVFVANCAHTTRFCSRFKRS